MRPSLANRALLTAAAVTVVSTLAALAPAARADGAAVDYIADAKVFYRVVACKGTDPVPAGLDAAVVDKHCAEMAKRYVRFSSNYLAPASAFFAALRPAGIPTTVVYPFGGGDLASALVTYPDAREITTISLEHAGDPTRLAKLAKKGALSGSLSAYRTAVEGLLALNDSTSDNMQDLERGGIPGQLSFHLTGMAALGYEPVSLKYFQLGPDGAVRYVTQADVDALAKHLAKKKQGTWTDPDFSEAYANMELAFRKVGEPHAPLVVFHHIAANLGDKAFVGSALQKHLQAKGKIVAITKAASYLLWSSGFSGIRDYLLANMVWMASDATGIPPKQAKKAGFQQITYGRFSGPFLPDAPPDVAADMVAMWAKQPSRKLPFRYGYPDSEKHLHLMITKLADGAPATAPAAPKPAPKPVASPAPRP